MTTFRAPSREEFQRMKPISKPFTPPKLVNPKDKLPDKTKEVYLPIRSK